LACVWQALIYYCYSFGRFKAPIVQLRYITHYVCDGSYYPTIAYYIELGLGSNTAVPSASPAPFDDKMCDLFIEFHPEVVSFHFGLPDKDLLARVRRTGAKIISSATCVDEARWLEDQGGDSIVAQGYEAGGHRGMFLTQD
jgi:nitronate monooxygenase